MNALRLSRLQKAALRYADADTNAQEKTASKELEMAARELLKPKKLCLACQQVVLNGHNRSGLCKRCSDLGRHIEAREALMDRIAQHWTEKGES